MIKQLVRRIPAKDRLKYIWDKAKGKTSCETDEPKREEGQDEGAPPEPDGLGHGGCGHVQPVIRKEGLKLFMVYKKGKEDDEVSRVELIELQLPCELLDSIC